jgi:RNA polymerase sigma-70 factor (sigma-E family)
MPARDGGSMDELGDGQGADPVASSVEELYRAHYPGLVRLAGLLLGDFFVGEEVAQDAFARLVDASAGVKAPVAYLRATVVNLSRSRIRRAILARRHRASQVPDPPGPEGELEGVAARLALRQELGNLPRRQREAVVLRFYAGLTDAEIAEAMRISTGSVKTHLHRAMATLSQRMEALR